MIQLLKIHIQDKRRRRNINYVSKYFNFLLLHLFIYAYEKFMNYMSDKYAKYDGIMHIYMTKAEANLIARKMNLHNKVHLIFRFIILSIVLYYDIVTILPYWPYFTSKEPHLNFAIQMVFSSLLFASSFWIIVVLIGDLLIVINDLLIDIKNQLR